MKPDEFWQLTYGEFNDLMRGYELRQDIEMQRLAWLASNLMNVHLKRKITPDKLLGKQQTMNREDKIAKFEKLKHKFEQRRAAE